MSAHDATNLGEVLPLWSVIPFAGMLLSIALLPLVRPHFWHRRFPLVSLAWGASFAVPFLFAYREAALHEILHIYIVDYIPFILLLWALYTAAGGISIGGSLRGTPIRNALALLLGTGLASWIGTTGASMILIRPLLRMNRGRKHRTHLVVFFIFLVSNIGGALTPLGDPPLFLGFLNGVPFFWTFRLFLPMLFLTGLLLAAFVAIDSLYCRRDAGFRAEEDRAEPGGLRIEGLRNLVFIGGMIAAILVSGVWKGGSFTILGIDVPHQNAFRDSALVAMGLLSLALTPKRIRAANEFGWFPMKEVAYLFAGIFVTIVPALAILKAGSRGPLGFVVDAVESPSHYFWATGILSSFLDNAPTYLAFFNSALGKFCAGMPEAEAVAALVAEHSGHLAAISMGAVFMGANTYIGNAPNFMVRSIAEEAGVAMPSFFGYLLKYAVPILVPCFFLLMLVFL
ncbi:MAG: sodium:proton antiporter [Candidatus Latescibacterota bacterium]|nr:MAG: sodium:proton antiporter [Candidatus Latescibacterota bacterium]